jgi:hypothetical protein
MTDHAAFYYVWYRMFKFSSGENYSPERIKLGGGYFFDSSPSFLSACRLNLELAQNHSPRVRKHVAALRFYERFLDPVVLPCVRSGLFLFRCCG